MTLLLLALEIKKGNDGKKLYENADKLRGGQAKNKTSDGIPSEKLVRKSDGCINGKVKQKKPSVHFSFCMEHEHKGKDQQIGRCLKQLHGESANAV